MIPGVIMRRPVRFGLGIAGTVAIGSALAIGTAGCGAKPNAANIELRKSVQTLEAENTRLKREHAADRAEIAALRTGTTLPSLPEERIRSLYTVAGIAFGRLTGGADLDTALPGDEGVKIYFWPIDADGDLLKAAGSVTVELFDLSADAPRLGRWTFDNAQARATWASTFVLQGYVLSCKWQTPPTQGRLRVRVAFTDALTGRQFTAERELTANVPQAATSRAP